LKEVGESKGEVVSRIGGRGAPTGPVEGLGVGEPKKPYKARETAQVLGESTPGGTEGGKRA